MDPIQGFASAEQLLSIQPPPSRDDPAQENKEEERAVDEEKGRVVDTSA
jgi:hypothetical protein